MDQGVSGRHGQSLEVHVEGGGVKKRKDGRGCKTSKRLWYMHEGERAECGARGFTEREREQ